MSTIPQDAQYVVLGAFFVTDIWQEMGVALPKADKADTVAKTKSKKAGDLLEYPMHKLRLQRVDVTEAPVYWRVEDTSADDDGAASTPNPEYHCPTCGVGSPRAFDGKEICLNSMCNVFFHEDGTQLSASDPTLQYSKTFMNSTTSYTGDCSKIPSGFQPPPANDENGWGSEKAFRMGMVCPECGCCNSRVHWNFWNCINCGYIYKSEPKAYPMTEVNKESTKHNNKFNRRKQPQYQTFKLDQTTISMNGHFVTMFTNTLDQDKDSAITTYMIFNQDREFLGSVVHERPSKATLQMPGGSNELFQEAQKSMEAMKMKRNPCRCVDSRLSLGEFDDYKTTDNKTGRIETLTRHFQHNFVSLGIHADLIDTKAGLLTGCREWSMSLESALIIRPSETPQTLSSNPWHS